MPRVGSSATPPLPTRPGGPALRPRSLPATVRFVFPGAVEWSFPRALLEKGLRTPARRGDIEVWPCGRVQTVVEFHTEEGVKVVQFDTATLVRFLRHTYSSNPSGSPAASAPDARTPSARR